MSLVTAILIGLLMGAVFGFALEKSRVFEPGVIVGQMQLRNFIMLKVFLTAVATGAVVLAVLNGFGFVKLAPKATLYGADIVGGLILGMGIALAGACPGTVMAQIGAGYRDAIVTLIGGLAGAVAYSYAEPALSKTMLGVSSGKLVLNTMLGIPYWAARSDWRLSASRSWWCWSGCSPPVASSAPMSTATSPRRTRSEPPARAVPVR